MHSGNNEPIRPYVSKRKRKAVEQLMKEQPKQAAQIHMLEIFKTDENIYRHSIKPSHGNVTPSSVNRIIPVHNGPMWAAKWCHKFSHLIACTAAKSVRLFNIFQNDSPQVWESLESEKMIRDIDWSPSSRQLVACGFDKSIKMWDFFDGGKVSSFKAPEPVTVVKWFSDEDNLFLAGGENSFLSMYDIRTGKPAIIYTPVYGNILDIDFIPGTGTGTFVASCDAVSKASAAYSLVVWDFATGAKLSDQIFHEKYTCPKVRVHPSGSSFLAQTTGDYIARFQTQKPHKLDRRLRYDKHKVQDYHIGMDISPDGGIVASGSCNGKVVFYKYKDASMSRDISVPKPHEIIDSEKENAILSVQFHPVLPSMVAIGDWYGRIVLLK